MERSLVLFAVVAVVALITVASMPASQQASAHHKAHTASTQVSTTVVAHHKAHTASTQVSTTVVAHHKAHTASKGKISVHHKVIAVIPEAHGIPLLNATALKIELNKEVKGPYGESDIIGGMMSGGY